MVRGDGGNEEVPKSRRERRDKVVLGNNTDDAAFGGRGKGTKEGGMVAGIRGKEMELDLLRLHTLM